MAMNDAEAERQIQQMVNFILNEAKDKAEEIEAKALEDFNIEKLKLVQQMKDKIRQEYVRKAKQVETQCAIARSTAINKARLEKIKARQEVLGKVQEDVTAKLMAELRSEPKHKKLITDLIAQGLLMLLEDDVSVQCRECDQKLVQGCLADAAAKYSQVIREQTGVSKTVKLTLSRDGFLPGPPGAGAAKSCVGGVILSCDGGKIKVNNTLDERLKLTMELDKPAIRGILFPVK
jgi:V-type H+-transporting ATPase subunit E